MAKNNKKKKSTEHYASDVERYEAFEKDVKIEERNISDISEEWVKIFGGNVNIYRITPHAVDGLKPVERRVLYALHTNPNKGLAIRKVQRIAGDTMAYHPHGDASISDVIFGMGQSWKKNIMYLDPSGNFGNIAGDSPAHPRYPDTKLSRVANYIFFSDFKDSNVPMRPNYSETELEPDYLPARIPIVLCNPHFSGIGVGVAANLPPFNPKEVVDATIKLIKNPKAKITLFPDSPTGCDIIDEGQFERINESGGSDGKCKFTMRATYEIDYIKNRITITSLPLTVTSDQVVGAIVAMRKAGKLDGLIDIADDSANDIVDITITLKKDVNPDEFIEKIMGKKTNLKKTFPVEIRVTEDFKPHVWGVRKTLKNWIEGRRDSVRAIYNKKLMNTLSDHHMNEIYLFVFSKDNLDKTISIARKSKNREEMEKKFIETYKITSLQAKALSKMGVYQFNKDSYEQYKENKKKYEADIKYYEAVLDDDDAVDKIIIEQLTEFNELFPYPRKSAIVKGGKMKEKIPNTYHLVGISRDGYIKKLSLEKSVAIGTVGKTSQVIVTKINNRDNLLIFDSSGRISRVGVSSLPDMEYDEPGVELSRYFTLKGTPVSIINECEVSNDDDMNDIILVTEQGFGKKTKVSEFAKIKDFKEAVQLAEGDQLISAIPAMGDEFIIYTNFGDGIRLHTNDIKRQSKNARGLSLMTLRAGEKVVGIDFLAEGCNQFLYVTSAGRMKMTEEKYFPVMSRKDEPLCLIGLEANETLVGVAFVKKHDRVMIYRKKGDPVEVDLKDVPVTSRVAKAEKLVKLPHGDSVTGFKIMRFKSV